VSSQASRVSALPDQAEPVQRSQLLAALSVGIDLLKLRHAAGRLGLGKELHTALAALAQGDSTVATAQLVSLDHILASIPDADPSTEDLAMRARASILGITQILTLNSAYFDAGAPNEVHGN